MLNLELRYQSGQIIPKNIFNFNADPESGSVPESSDAEPDLWSVCEGLSENNDNIL